MACAPPAIHADFFFFFPSLNITQTGEMVLLLIKGFTRRESSFHVRLLEFYTPTLGSFWKPDFCQMTQYGRCLRMCETEMVVIPVPELCVSADTEYQSDEQCFKKKS